MNDAQIKDTPVLTLEGVVVTRGELPLCRAVDLCLHRGEIYHLLGENGLGKTTLLMQIMGLLPTLFGQVSYLGEQGVAKGALYISHQAGVHENLSVRQNLRYLLALYGETPSDDALKSALASVGLLGFEDLPVAGLSAGQTRRVGLARLWLLSPKVMPLWVLDEPLTALDVAMVARLCERLAQFAREGGAVLLTSHQPVPVATHSFSLVAQTGEEDDWA